VQPARAKPTPVLVLDPTPPHLGELAWRIGLALAGVNFVLIAAAVSSVNPRGGRSGNLVFALFTFVVYYNLVNLGQSWIGSGRATFLGMLVGLHAGMAVAGGAWLWKRHNNWTLRSALRRRPA
jgi:lipopolysaccharide export system permease protein